MEIFKS
jgi:hypothetical protein